MQPVMPLLFVSLALPLVPLAPRILLNVIDVGRSRNLQRRPRKLFFRGPAPSRTSCAPSSALACLLGKHRSIAAVWQVLSRVRMEATFTGNPAAAGFMSVRLEHVVNTLLPVQGASKDILAKCTVAVKSAMKDASSKQRDQQPLRSHTQLLLPRCLIHFHRIFALSGVRFPQCQFHYFLCAFVSLCHSEPFVLRFCGMRAQSPPLSTRHGVMTRSPVLKPTEHT